MIQAQNDTHPERTREYSALGVKGLTLRESSLLSTHLDSRIDNAFLEVSRELKKVWRNREANKLRLTWGHFERFSLENRNDCNQTTIPGMQIIIFNLLKMDHAKMALTLLTIQSEIVLFMVYSKLGY